MGEGNLKRDCELKNVQKRHKLSTCTECSELTFSNHHETPRTMLNTIMKNGRTVDTWLVYENWTEALECIYVGYCRLERLSDMREPRSNYEWIKRTQDATIIVQVVAAFPTLEAARDHAIGLAYERKAICNLLQTDVRKMRAIECSDGNVYASQVELARALGLSQSAVSKVLNGHLTKTNGYSFRYKA